MASEREELELADQLDEAGLTVYKSPASGSTSRAQVDLTAWGLDDADVFRAFAIEHKSSSDDLIYLAADQIDQLRSVAVGPFEPVISTYFKYDAGRVSPSEHPPYGNDADDGYRFIRLADLDSDADRSVERRYRIKRAENWERGLKLEDLLAPRGSNPLVADGGTEADQPIRQDDNESGNSDDEYDLRPLSAVRKRCKIHPTALAASLSQDRSQR
jgi:Holliday junction resolvase